MDEEEKRRIDTAVSEYRKMLAEVDVDTREQAGEKYYEIWKFNSEFGNLMLSTGLVGKWDRESLLSRGFFLMTNEAYVIHDMVTRGEYFPALRELRFLLEFAKRAAILDIEMPGTPASNKLREYEAREDSDKSDFRGGGLLSKLKGNLSLSDQEEGLISDLFGRLSSSAHGSAREIQAIGKGGSFKAAYVKDLFDEAHTSIAAVMDVYLLLLIKRGMVSKSDVKLPTNLASLFPLSYPILGI
jgi:hypothetical protein